jgi:hypothetical protein
MMFKTQMKAGESSAKSAHRATRRTCLARDLPTIDEGETSGLMKATDHGLGTLQLH